MEGGEDFVKDQDVAFPLCAVGVPAGIGFLHRLYQHGKEAEDFIGGFRNRHTGMTEHPCEVGTFGVNHVEPLLAF